MEGSGFGSKNKSWRIRETQKHTDSAIRIHNTAFNIVEFRMHCKKGWASTEVTGTGTWQLAGYMNMTFFMRTGEACGIPRKVGGRELHLKIRITDPHLMIVLQMWILIHHVLEHGSAYLTIALNFAPVLFFIRNKWTAFF